MNPTYDKEIDHAKLVLPSEVDNIELLAVGKRGVILKAIYRGKPVVVKLPRSDSKANSMTLLESRNLKKVNAWGIGPKLINATEDYVLMHFVKGKLIGEFLNDPATVHEEKLMVFQNTLEQLQTLDEKGLNKFELTKPYKHIIVRDDLSIVLIDFERARATERPKNVAQFREYMKIFGY